MKRNHFYSAILLCLVPFLFSCTSTVKKVTPESVGLSGDTLEIAAQKMQEYVDNGEFAGITSLVFKNGEMVHRQNVGLAGLINPKPLDDQTIFRIFSMTKPVTAVALMTLYDEGKFQLDDKVSKFIPEFAETQVYNAETKILEPQVNELTIRHLLTHTSGIPYGWDQTAYVDSLYRVTGVGGWDGTIGEKVKALAQLPLKNQPGTKWEYGLSIDVAGYLVEVLSGTPLDVYMKTKIFDPLKMNDTGFFVPEEKLSRFSGLFSLRADSLVEMEGGMGAAFKNPVTLFSGGGGLVSTASDYLTFCKMLLNGGELDGARIISEAATQLIMSNQLPEGLVYAENKGYGLAGEVNLETGVYGWAGAASTKFWIDKNHQMIISTFAQRMPAEYSYADEFYSIVSSGLQ